MNSELQEKMASIDNMPIEIIEEIIFNITDPDDLKNTLRTFMFSPSYHYTFLKEKHIWTKLLKIHYPFYNVNPNEHKIKLLFHLLDCYPNLLDEANWKLVKQIERDAAAYPCPITYMVMRGNECGEGTVILMLELSKKY